METNQSESSTSATGLIIISKLYQEGKISDEDREKLKGKFSKHIWHFDGLNVFSLVLLRSIS